MAEVAGREDRGQVGNLEFWLSTAKPLNRVPGLGRGLVSLLHRGPSGQRPEFPFAAFGRVRSFAFTSAAIRLPFHTGSLEASRTCCKKWWSQLV